MLQASDLIASLPRETPDPEAKRLSEQPRTSRNPEHGLVKQWQSYYQNSHSSTRQNNVGIGGKNDVSGYNGRSNVMAGQNIGGTDQSGLLLPAE